MSYSQDNWDEILGALEFAYNDSKHAVTGETPFMFDTGKHSSKLADLLLSDQETTVLCIEELVASMAARNDRARGAIDLGQKIQQRYANRGRRGLQFGVGDQVMLSTR